MDSAIQSFKWIGKIVVALHPFLDRDLNHHAASVNPEAGNHAMPQDPVEIQLALRAGQKAWTKFPYSGFRFSERGRRFTSSDSCWLVSLYRLSPEMGIKSLEWLRTVLSTRGLPSVILDAHLLEIKSAFASLLGENNPATTGYDFYLSKREAERDSYIAEKIATVLSRQYESLLGAASGFKMPGVPTLIISSWVDERSGIEGALDAVRTWFQDSGRFSPDWIELIYQLIAELDHKGLPQ